MRSWPRGLANASDYSEYFLLPSPIIPSPRGITRTQKLSRSMRVSLLLQQGVTVSDFSVYCIQFSLKACLGARGSPCVLNPSLGTCLSCRHFETVRMLVRLRWAFLVLSRTIVERFLFPRLSPPDDRCCDVLGFVPTGSV